MRTPKVYLLFSPGGSALILFRADGNKEIGSGHVMRCLSIADALSDMGNRSLFVTADNTMSELIEGRGYPCIVLHTDYKNMDCETGILVRQREFAAVEGIVVDSYYATEGYLKTLSREKKTVYIDDYIKKRPCDAVINYNVFADESSYSGLMEDPSQKFILGPAYAPLRREFADAVPIEIKEKAKRVLFLAGGSDPAHAALHFAKEIINRKDLMEYIIVTGAMSGDHSRINAMAARSGGRLRVLSNVKDMKSLMTSVDLTISAAGSTLYELCACGVPTLCYILADNQRLVAEGFKNKGAMIYAGDLRSDKDFYSDLYDSVMKLADDLPGRRVLSEKARGIVDGNGAKRLAAELKRMFA